MEHAKTLNGLTKGQLVRMTRLITGESQTEMADRLEYSKSYLCKIEYDVRPPSFNFALKLKQEYHMDLLF